jgi:hypothetical protein
MALAEIINNRPVAFIGHGPSLKDLDKWIERFRTKDICWVSLNQVGMARNILKKIGQDLDIILGYAAQYEEAFKDETCYVHMHSEGRGNSLCEFLYQMNEIRCDVVLFGCDGYSDKESYYNGGGCENQNLRHKNDCDDLNRRLGDFKNIKVLNTCLTSKYDFEKIEFCDLFKKWGMEKSISILFPTRDRPLLLCHLLLGLEQNTLDRERIEVLIAHDEDDDLTPHIVSGIKTKLHLRAVQCKRRENLHSYYNELFRLSAN